ncbi:HAD family phosphatase [Palleronia sp. LCG004]|uniref:HAD family hydrolase n=1 Tax=Palleronia sp. LCG004 TaxID=3079304 RepID=UPI0029433876|nr:HAD family phosphatase [Palleronia sp. LCG004]WOI55548.1 HAD family phosphatase [Palleronia sp. LCG004]
MAVDAVIFDIGNVLIEWQPERFYDSEIGRDRREAMFAAIDLHAMNDRVDAGEDFRSVVYEAADANPEWADEIRMWHDRWIEMATPAIPQSVFLLRALRSKGIPVWCLTNFGIQSFDFAKLHYDFLDEFDRFFVSGHMGVIKPDPRIYEMVEEESPFQADRLLFTDDKQDNIAAASARGWQVHHFDGPHGWATRLMDEGLLSEAEARA